MGNGLKHRTALAFLGVISTGLVTCGSPLVALASENQTVFIAHYEHNAQTEANLLQTAQSSTASNAATAILQSAVENISNQLLQLYTAEQVLANEETRILSANPPIKMDVSKLLGQRRAARVQLRAEERALKDARKQHDAALVQQLQDQHDATLTQLGGITALLKLFNNPSSHLSHESLDASLSNLQSTITHLQSVAIHYTQLWIQFESPTASAVASSISGLSYASTVIHVPADGSDPVTDTVSTQPVVTDENDTVLRDTGVYGIAGPDNSTGVVIDPISGTISVSSKATPGQYTVTYAQSSVNETVTLTIS